jgi:hypothetical protein
MPDKKIQLKLASYAILEGIRLLAEPGEID